MQMGGLIGREQGQRQVRSGLGTAARGLHGEIVHHVGAEEEGLEGAEDVGDASALLDDLFVGALGVDVQLPGVFKGVNLSAPRTKTCPRGPRGNSTGCRLSRRRGRLILAGVEGRVEIDEIDCLVLDIALEEFEIVAVIEVVFLDGHRIGLGVTQGDAVCFWGRARLRRVDDLPNSLGWVCVGVETPASSAVHLATTNRPKQILHSAYPNAHKTRAGAPDALRSG
jgi:hypothetical protein